MDGTMLLGLRSALLTFALLMFVVALAPSAPKPPPPTFSDFLTHVERGEVRDVLMRTRDNSMRVELDAGRAYEIGYAPDYGDELLRKLKATGSGVEIEPDARRWFEIVLPALVVVALLAALWFFVLRRSVGGGKLGAFGRAKAVRVSPDTPQIGFDAVAGVDEVVAELGEI